MSEKRSPRYGDGARVKEWHKFLARLVASLIVTFFRVLEAVLKTLFSILFNIAQAI